MATLIAIPILGGLMILQTSIISRIPLLFGTADLPLLAIIAWALQKRVRTAWQWSLIGGLMFSLATALPLGVPILGYSLSTGLALILRRRVWQVPILAMFATTFLCTLITQGIALLALRLVGDPIPIGEAFNLIILPSVLINMLLAIPIYALISDLAKWLYPEELEV
ncbi:MAG: rod shape-determining protein MreD [Anaerolineales bacterium]